MRRSSWSRWPKTSWRRFEQLPATGYRLPEWYRGALAGSRKSVAVFSHGSRRDHRQGLRPALDASTLGLRPTLPPDLPALARLFARLVDRAARAALSLENSHRPLHERQESRGSLGDGGTLRCRRARG